jgi:hypothetical protein
MADPVSLKNFPLAAIVDGLLSYLQFVFSTPEIVPSEYRWNADDRKTKIRISAPFVVDDEKPFSCPFIVAERGGFAKDDRIIDNLKSSDANTLENPERVVIWNGSLNIICGGRSASETSSIANFLLINIDADRHGIIKNLKFIRNLKSMSIGPEIPIKKRDEIIRWQVTLVLSVSLQMGWKGALTDPDKFEQFSLKAIDTEKTSSGDAGIITKGIDTLVDNTKSFGFKTTDDPQLLEQEFEKGWYYIRFDEQLYKIVKIIDKHTLQLVMENQYREEVPWEAPETKDHVIYDLLWNSIHVIIQLPKEL